MIPRISIVLAILLASSVARADPGQAAGVSGTSRSWASPPPTDASRIGTEIGLGLLPGALGAGLGIVIWVADASSCVPEDWFCGVGGGVAGAVLGLTIATVGTPFAVGLAHRGQGGRGREGWMIAGGLIGLAVGAGAGALIAHAWSSARPEDGRWPVALALALADLGYLAGLVIGIELDHAERRDRPTWLIGATPGGLSLAGTF